VTPSTGAQIGAIEAAWQSHHILEIGAARRWSSKSLEFEHKLRADPGFAQIQSPRISPLRNSCCLEITAVHVGLEILQGGVDSRASGAVIAPGSAAT